MAHELGNQVDIAGHEPCPNSEGMPQVVKLVTLNFDLAANVLELIGVILRIVTSLQHLLVDLDQVVIERNLAIFSALRVLGGNQQEEAFENSMKGFP